MEEPILKYIIWFLVCVFSSVITAISGGGGMLSLPVLISLGLPEAVLLGTNKAVLTTGTLTATIRYIKSGVVKFNRLLITSCFISFFAAIGGAECSRYLDTQWMLYLLLFIISSLFCIEFLKKRHPQKEKNKAKTPLLFIYLTVISMGFYNGFFGPGTGVISFFLFSYLTPMKVMESVAFSKTIAVVSSLTAFAYFTYLGRIDWSYAGIGILGAIIGSWTGAGIALKVDSKKVKIFFNVILSIFLIKILFDIFY
ncbi:sulfite exporter TauE/SafE family protein [Flammeovirga pectinis]|uniref:sulfite exporter TauE/SafE family protein n=1 Tax=Flammeovirga pectinis TaxID=2494373 RepID=UPI00147766FF|nr:sulfite exporter TauE/SafE family protein [Flammeovirga pectinis]